MFLFFHQRCLILTFSPSHRTSITSISFPLSSVDPRRPQTLLSKEPCRLRRLLVTFRAILVAVAAVESRVLILITTLTFWKWEKKHKVFLSFRALNIQMTIQMTHMIDLLGSGHCMVEYIIVRQVLFVQIKVHVPGS